MNELKQRFADIANNNEWGSRESISGSGSELKNTEVISNELYYLMKKFRIKSMLDIPCGDFNWMKHVGLDDIDYHGADIVDSIIENHKINYPDKKWKVQDITTDDLRQVDLIFVRDCIGHFSDVNIFKALENIRRSGSKYLLVTSFTKYNHNPNIPDGAWKPINLMIAPYFLKPIYLINEDCQEGYPSYNDKCMILVDLSDMYSK